MYGHIFSPQDWWDMASAAERLGSLRYPAQGHLTNTLVKIESIGDPYYMDLRADTYFAAIGSEGR